MDSWCSVVLLLCQACAWCSGQDNFYVSWLVLDVELQACITAPIERLRELSEQSSSRKGVLSHSNRVGWLLPQQMTLVLFWAKAVSSKVKRTMLDGDIDHRLQLLSSE
jgi:hypothetical protein